MHAELIANTGLNENLPQRLSLVQPHPALLCSKARRAFTGSDLLVDAGKHMIVLAAGACR